MHWHMHLHSMVRVTLSIQHVVSARFEACCVRVHPQDDVSVCCCAAPALCRAERAGDPQATQGGSVVDLIESRALGNEWGDRPGQLARICAYVVVPRAACARGGVGSSLVPRHQEAAKLLADERWASGR